MRPDDLQEHTVRRFAASSVQLVAPGGPQLDIVMRGSLGGQNAALRRACKRPTLLHAEPAFCHNVQ